MSDPQLGTGPQNPEPSGDNFGWLWFILIYGVGNIIRYNTTGMLLLPIPRK
jgi:hypothetical protein